MKTILIRNTLRAWPIAWLASLCILLTASLDAQTVVKPRGAPRGEWTLIGTTVANYSADHDSIIVRGKHDDFSQIMFKVTEAPLNMHRLVVTYDNGEPDEIAVRQKIRKGGQSRAIDLRGGVRSIRRIDFWYDTRGSNTERAEVTVFGRK